MKKILLAALAIFSLFIFTFFSSITGYFIYGGRVVDFEKSFVLGYCPTMEVYAQELSETYNLELVEFNSASLVLHELREDRLDFALIGRKAEEYEFEGNELFLREGYTLIGPQKVIIFHENLADLEVATYISKSETETNFPELNRVTYYQSLDDALFSQNLIIIDWADWRDEFNLVIPVDIQGNKIPSYRVPVLYSKGIDLSLFDV